MRQNLPLKYKTQNLISYLVKYPLCTLPCSQKETFLSYRTLELVLSRLHALVGSIFGLIKGSNLQTCGAVHKSRSPYKHREEDAESSEKSAEANMSSHHFKADLHDECSLNTSCLYSNGKFHLLRRQENLGSRNRLRARARGAESGIRSPTINSSAHIPECICAQFLSHKMSPSLHTFCVHQAWHAVKKMLTSLAKIYSPFLTTCAIHFFQPQYSSTPPVPPPPAAMDTHFFHPSHPLFLFLFFTVRHIPTVSISLSLSHTYVLLGREQIGEYKLDMETGRYKHSHSLDSVWRDFLACRSGFMSQSIYLSVELLESNSALCWSWAGIHQKELSRGVWKRRLKLPLNS
ncbi:LOW QUALITY PROTEIN: uncharacterized protein RDI95_002962 [Morus bassanus]